MALQTVRSTINEYRDARRYSLVRMRNQSFSSLIVLSLILFAMVALSTIIGVPIENLALATGYFLVAACTGVIARLRAMGQSEFGVEDYGLATMRLLTRPFTSGIAAIFGVGVIGLQPERLLNGGMLSGTLKATDLLHVFSAGMAGAGFLLAAFFGLAPEVVFGRYTRLAENYGKELKDSKASEAASPS